MKRFEYMSKVVGHGPSFTNFIKDLEVLGSQGWEMCGAAGGEVTTTFFFKRELPEAYPMGSANNNRRVKVW